MDPAKQRLWRMIIPGIMMGVTLVPALSPFWDAVSANAFLTSVAGVLLPTASVALGALYSMFGLGAWGRKPYLLQINDFIVDELLRESGMRGSFQNIPRRDYRDLIMNAFFAFINSHPELTHMNAGALLHGLYWSSSVDLLLIGGFASVAYLAGFFCSGSRVLLLCSLGCGAAYTLALVLAKKMTGRYKALAKRQIGVMRRDHTRELHERMERVARQLPA